MADISKNPFNISFGEEPNAVINRSIEYNEIVSLFENESPESKAKIITGPRGCGKTVLLTQIKNHFDKKDNWITVDLTQYSNMLEQMAGKLYENGKVKKLFLKPEFNFSFNGLGFSIKGDKPISNVESLLERILDYLLSKNVRVLVTIDDISNNDFTKQFIQTYQSFIRVKYQVYLLITGLYENVNDLQNTKNLTFLIRAPKLFLSKLNLREIALTYKKYLNINEKEAVDLAKFSQGYAYAYQLIGNALFKSKKNVLEEDQIESIDVQLETNVYAKIWDSMSPTDKQVAFAMLEYSDVSEIIKHLGMNNAKFQIYRRRLINIGVADDVNRGFLTFNLPRFAEFVRFQKLLLEE